MNLRKDVVGNRANKYTLLSLTKQGIIPRNLENAVGKFPSSFDTYQVVEAGDLLFCLFDMDETPRTVGLSRLNGMVTGAYTRFACGDRNLREFLFLLYLSFDNRKLLKPLYSGLRKVIPKITFLNAKIALPSEKERAAIVRYLDRMDRRIRRYVTAKEKLIGLLQEDKQAIVNQAVTRGLDPNVRLKPSGVEWLGDVPTHWEIAKIKNLARSSKESFVDGDWIESPYITSEGIRLIQTGNIGIGEYREKGFRYISEETFKNFACTEFLPGDVLICRLGEPVARACLAPQLDRRMITSVDVCILKPRDDVNPQFVVYCMSSRKYLDWVGSLVRGSTRDRVSRSMLGTFPIPVPTLAEQCAIVEHLDKATADIATAITRVRRQIDLLREHRTRLIADVVTGKLDVREAAVECVPVSSGEDTV